MLNIEIIPASEIPEALLWKNRSSRNQDWDYLAERLQSAKVGDWLRVLTSELSGKSPEAKRTNISTSMKNRGLNVTTSHYGAHIWIRLRTADEPLRKSASRKKN